MSVKVESNRRIQDFFCIMGNHNEYNMEQLIHKLNELRYKIIDEDLKGRKRQQVLFEIEDIEEEIKERQEY